MSADRCYLGLATEGRSCEEGGAPQPAVCTLTVLAPPEARGERRYCEVCVHKAAESELDHRSDFVVVHDEA